MARNPSKAERNAPAESPPSIEPVDLGDARVVGEPPAGAASSGHVPPTLDLRPYSPERQREDVRARVTLFLLWTLAAALAAILATVWFAWRDGAEAAERVASVKDLAGLILGPLVALLGTAMGFYFGAQRPKGE